MSDDKIIPFPKRKKDQVESCEAPVWPMISISSYKVEDMELNADQMLKILNDLFGKSAVELELEDLLWRIKEGIKMNPDSAEFVIENLKRLANSFEKK